MPFSKKNFGNGKGNFRNFEGEDISLYFHFARGL